MRVLVLNAGSSSTKLRVVEPDDTVVHRAETGVVRSGRVTTAYEEVLGLAAGTVRAPVDILCRTFPQVSPRDADPGSRIETVRELSQLTERLQGAVPVTGGARPLSGGSLRGRRGGEAGRGGGGGGGATAWVAVPLPPGTPLYEPPRTPPLPSA